MWGRDGRVWGRGRSGRRGARGGLIDVELHVVWVKGAEVLLSVVLCGEGCEGVL